MILRSAICSKACASVIFLLVVWAPRAMTASLTGQVRLVESKEKESKKKDFSSVVVWLTPMDGSSPGLARKHVQLIQKNKKFTPHILAIEIGTTVEIPNLDPIYHNAFSNFDGEIFDIGLYPPGTSRSVRFTKPGIVKVFCNIHPSMSATIVVLDSRFIELTDHAGRYSFTNVPPGIYRLHFFHERATAETLEKLAQTVVLDNEPRDTPLTTISEAGYLPVAHKNKYGRDYPPGSDSPDLYSGPVR